MGMEKFRDDLWLTGDASCASSRRHPADGFAWTDTTCTRTGWINQVGRWAMAALLVAATSTGSIAAENSSARPQVMDGMHAAEKSRAMRALERSGSAAQRQALGTNRSTQDLAAPAEPQLLLMERRHIKGTTQRTADAWFYSYPNNETIHKIVDLETGTVLSSQIVIGTQLPLVEAEISRAFSVLLASRDDRRALEVAYRAVSGEEFVERSQVSYKAFVFHPDTVVDGLSRAARRCGTNRCAQMLIYTHDNIALDMSPVVDLSTGKVLQNLELRAQAIVRRAEAAL